MPDWDADSPQLRANLTRVIQKIAQAADLREEPEVESARTWQRDSMTGLVAPDSRYVGRFGVKRDGETVQVKVFSNYGTAADRVAEELARFETRLKVLVAELDSAIPIGQQPDTDQLAAVVDICAWVHAEWVRIHPFANGNGRTARLWANSIAMRYGLPPFIRLRPRPNGSYAEAGARAMRGEWQPTAELFRRFLNDFLNEL